MDRQKLKELLNKYDEAYYNRDESLISDAEYDALKEQYGEYEYVPGEASSDLPRVKHTHSISSLDKVNTLEDLRVHMKRLAPFIMQPKIDGLTVVAYPEVFATRGNGEYGEDITSVASGINGLGDVIAQRDPVRMEAFMRKSVFKAINEDRERDGLPLLKNPRNAAAGMLRNKDVAKVYGIDYMAYNIVGSKAKETEQMYLLQLGNFRRVPSVASEDGIYVFEEKDIDIAIELVKNFDRGILDYEIDGLVIKSNIYDSLGFFGSTGHHPKNAVAFKFQAEGAWTRLLGVTFQVGRTGKVTPVAEIEPVEILGSTISRVTLHNESIIEALGIDQDCQVYVIKANDVIPAITKCIPANRAPIDIPYECPVCDSRLTKVNDQLFCVSDGCRSKFVGAIVHLAKRDALDIKGLSEETASKIVDKGLLHPFDIFLLEISDIKSLPGFAEKSARNLYSSIQSARTADLNRFLYAADVPGIGRSASRDIASYFLSYENLMDNIREAAEIEGIGPTSMESIMNHWNRWEDLRQFVTPVDIVIRTQSSNSLSVVVTGTFMDGDKKVPRKEIEDRARAAGHKISSSVSKNTDIVVIGEKAGSKEKAALNLVNEGHDIRIIRDLKEFIHLMG